MNHDGLEIESIPLREIAEALRRTRPFAETDPTAFLDALDGVEYVERIQARAGTELVRPGDPVHYWLVLEGETRAERPETDGSRTMLGGAGEGEGFGETPLLTGKT